MSNISAGLRIGLDVFHNLISHPVLGMAVFLHDVTAPEDEKFLVDRYMEISGFKSPEVKERSLKSVD